MAVTVDQSAQPKDSPQSAEACDREIIELAESFEDFYQREFRNIAGLAYSLCGSTGAAEDITQDAFLAAFRQWDRLREPGAWVRKAVVNKSVSQFRRRASEAKALLRLFGNDRPDIEMPDADEDLWKQVRRLPKRQAQVLALRYVDRNSIAEIASLLDLSENTVKTHLLRGKQTLNERLADAS